MEAGRHSAKVQGTSKSLRIAMWRRDGVLEHTTVFAMQGALMVLMGAVILLAFRGERRQRGDGSGPWLAAGYCLGGVGLCVLALERHLPLPVIAPIGNALFLLFSPLVAQGLAKATRQRTSMLVSLSALAAAAIAVLYYLAYVQPDDLARLTVSAVVSTVMYSSVIVLLMRSKEVLIRQAQRAMIFLFLFQIVTVLARAFVWHLTHTLSWLAGMNIITSVGVALSYLWMNHVLVHAELEKTAMTDPLTGLYNRRALDVIGVRELDAARQKCEPCSALMLDLDEFKQVNDSLGHKAGDASLRAVAEMLTNVIRPHDLATRLGGDEFFVLLPGADERTTQEIIGRLEAHLQAIRLSAGGVTYTIEAAIGRVTLYGDKVTLDELLHASDVILYREKQLNRAKRAFVSATDLSLENDGLGSVH
jgi:diguanylate cyclase (GGDEF)-like protein